MTTPRFLEAQFEEADSRLGAANFLRRNAKKVFPDHWTFLLGEIALYAFIIEILTGIWLAFFFEASMTEVVYQGSYEKLQGVSMSAAYASTLDISFDIRGGLLMRQIHHWAALVFVAAIFVHMIRIFFTGAFRRPREMNWVIGIIMLTLAVVEGFIGYGLPDDLLSGIGLRITQGFILAIPVIGTFASFLVFGGAFPGEFVARLFIGHVLIIPGLLLALISVHLILVWHQKHTQFPGAGKTERNVIGQPTYPHFMAKTGAYFFFVFGVLALLGGFIQINPIWLYGPYTPANVFAGAQPDWYVGFLEGSARLMPGAETVVLGHTFAWGVIVPAFIVPGILITFFALYPFLEQWATGDREHHHLLDRPRNVPTRTGIGAAGITFYGVLWAGGGNDVIAYVFDISLQATTWILRVLLFVGPAIAFYAARRICLGLQRQDSDEVHHGFESGMIYRHPEGGFSESHEELPENQRAVQTYKPALRRIDAPGWAESDVPPPRNVIGRLQARINHFYTDDHIEGTPGDGSERGWDEHTASEELTERTE